MSFNTDIKANTGTANGDGGTFVAGAYEYDFSEDLARRGLVNGQGGIRT
jgi:hypothetical protein